MNLVNRYFLKDMVFYGWKLIQFAFFTRRMLGKF